MTVLYINYLFDKTYSSVGAAVHVKEFTHAANQAGINLKSYDLNKFDGEEAASQRKTRAWLKSKLSRYLGQLNALISNITYFRREWRIVADEKPDALLVRYNFLNFSAPLIARFKKLPLVLEVNAPMALENQKFNKRQFHLPFFPHWAERLNLKLADRIYTVSHALRNYFVEQGVAPEKISVVPNGVDVDSFNPEIDGGKVRKKFSLKDRIVLGFVGSFHYWHGVEAFHEFVTKLCAQHEDIGFLFVGDGPLRAELEHKFKMGTFADRVAFTGYVEHEEMPQYLAAMDIVLAPYPDMPFFYFSPLKLFEYMAAGKPVVASRVGQIEEMIVDGVSGLLYEAGDIDALVACSGRLVENKKLRIQIGQQARSDVCANYSWKRNAERVVGLIKESMNGRNGSI